MNDYIVYAISLIVFYFLFRRLFLENFYISISGKYVLVTGCDSGFGRLLVLKLLENRVNVFAGCFTPKGITSLEEHWKSQFGPKGQLYTIRLDISSDESVRKAKELVERILKEKNASLWGLVNNAGIFTIFGPDDWCGSAEYMTSLNVNTLGAVRMCHQFVPLLKQSRGRVVTMASTAGRLHGLYVAPYVTAKYAVEGYMDCLRLEMRQFGVSVHILEPGAFKTELLDQNAQHDRIENIWNSLSCEIRDEYGEQFRRNFEVAWESGVNVVANRNIGWVADCYFHALFSWWPRLRYCPGWDAIFMFIPLSLCPTTIQDGVLSFLYSLSPGPALKPASLATKRTRQSKQETIQRLLSLLAQTILIPLVYMVLMVKNMVFQKADNVVVVVPGNSTVNSD